MTSRDINLKMLEMIPSIGPLFASVSEWQDGIDAGSSIIIDDVLMVYLRESLKLGHKKGIDDCKSFIEWMVAESDDEYVDTLLVIDIFEYIHYSSDRVELETALGPNAMEKYLSIEWIDKKEPKN